MKKALSTFIVLTLILTFFTACGSNSKNTTSDAKEKTTVLKVVASPVPHAEILNLIKPTLKKEGVDLQIIESTDYVTPNQSLYDKQVDANFFQHKPYLDEFN